MIHLGYASIFDHLTIILRGKGGGGVCNSFDTLLMICLGFVGMFENLKIMCDVCGFKNKRMVQAQQSESLHKGINPF
jgi:hypothetical protein